MKLTRMTRTAGWLAVAGMLSAALIAPASASANGAVYATVTGHEAFSADANKPDYWGDNCADLDVSDVDSYVLTQSYALVVVKAGSGAYANTLFADASSGETVWADTNGNFQFDPGGRGGDKQISHIIVCGPVTTTTTSTETTDTETTSTETTDTETTSTETTDTETTSTQTTDTETTSTQTTDTETTETVETPDGSVEAETGTPDVTPPSTDTGSISGPSSPSGSAWQLLLVAMAGLLATVLLLTPAAEARKR